MIFTSSTIADPSTITVDSYYATLAATTGNLTFSAAPNLAVGDKISIQNVSSVLNGEQTITAVSTNTVSFVSASITGDIATALAPNTVARSARVQVVDSVTEVPAATAVPVTSIPAATDDASYNVPGNLSYNADNAIDNIIVSNESAE